MLIGGAAAGGGDCPYTIPRQLALLRGHRKAATCIDVSPANDVATGSEDCTVRLWDTRAGRSSRSILGCFDECIDSVKYNKTSAHVLYVTCGHTLLTFDMRMEREETVLIKSPSARNGDITSLDDINCLAASTDGQRLAIGSDGGDIFVLDCNTKSRYHLKKRLARGHTSLVTSVAFHPNDKSKEVVSGGLDCTVCCWNYSTGRLLYSVNMASYALSRVNEGGGEGGLGQLVNPPLVHGLEYLPGGEALVAALGDGSVRLVGRRGTGADVLASSDELNGHCGTATCLHCPFASSAGAAVEVFTGGVDKTVKAWRASHVAGSASLSSSWTLLHSEKVNALGALGAQGAGGSPLLVADVTPVLTLYTVL